ncbi:hypothetical protein [Paraburkholderia sp. A1RO-1]|uniref:hypothetical protein n=1 Tax=unclassified Paraburkholderia TaxID=2615204 RepID=UPI003B80DEE5
MFAELRYAIGRARELLQLDREAQTCKRPNGCELVRLDHDKAVWRVPVPGHADRFIRVP